MKAGETLLSLQKTIDKLIKLDYYINTLARYNLSLRCSVIPMVVSISTIVDKEFKLRECANFFM